MQHVFGKFEISLKVLFMNVPENTGKAMKDNLVFRSL